MYVLFTEKRSPFANAGKATMVFFRRACRGIFHPRQLLLYCLLFGTLPLPVLAQSEIYTWVDEQGQRHYSDQRPEAGRKFRQVELEDQSEQPDSSDGERVKPSTARASSGEHKPARRRGQSNQRRAAEREKQEQRCADYLHKMEQVQEKLRRGYTEPKGNQLRQRRYELSQRYQRECQ